MPADMGELANAVVFLKAAQKSAQEMNEAADAANRQRHQTEMLSQIAKAYIALNAAETERSKLLDRIKELESIENIKSRYALVSLGASGVVAFAPIQPRPNEAPHHLCANCLNDGKVRYLQQTNHGPYVLTWQCHTCGERLTVNTGRPRPTSAHENGWTG